MKPEFINVTGLERLPAILTLKQLGLESYEICSCEPQEDLFYTHSAGPYWATQPDNK